MAYSESERISASEQVRGIAIGVARSRSIISYSELASRVTAITISHRSSVLYDLLRTVLDSEHSDRGLLLTAVVVHANHPRIPGRGFFDAAESLGYDVLNRRSFWEMQVERVYDHYEAATGSE